MIAPFPKYPAIRSAFATNTLPDYLDLSSDTVGATQPGQSVVVRLHGLARRFHVQWPGPTALDDMFASSDVGVPALLVDRELASHSASDTGSLEDDAPLPDLHGRTWSGSAAGAAPAKAAGA